MAEFFDILPPPQSIDDLDAWGALDALPASLNDGFWTRVGVYGLSASEKARAGQAFSVLRKRCVGLSAGAASRQTLGFLRVRVGELKGNARASGSVKAERKRPLVVRGAAEGAAGIAFARLRDGSAAFSAVSSQEAKALRVRALGLSAEQGEASAAFFAVAELALAGEGEARTGERAALARVRLVDGPALSARADGNAAFFRVMPLAARDGAAGSSLFTLFRVRPVVPEDAEARSAGGMAIMRLVGLACAGGAFGGGSALLVRVIDLSGRGSVLGVGSVFPEYKGWMWARRDDVPEGTWNQAHAGRADWRPRTVAGADWQGVVEWQQAE